MGDPASRGTDGSGPLKEGGEGGGGPNVQLGDDPLFPEGKADPQEQEMPLEYRLSAPSSSLAADPVLQASKVPAVVAAEALGLGTEVGE